MSAIQHLPGMSGWPRVLPDQLEGDHDSATSLAAVTAAIETERRTTQRIREVRIDSVEPVDAEAGLYRLAVTLPTRARLQQWAGATIWRDLRASGLPWDGEILDASRRERWLTVEVPPESPPQVGTAFIRPFDFLQAPSKLTSHPRLDGARPDYGRLLGAMTGALTGPAGIRGATGGAPWRGHPAWTHGVTMVWGPPGTGKTHTLVETVKALLDRSDERVLIVSTTNKATDEVAIRLGAQDGKVMRLGTVEVTRYREAGCLDVLPKPESRWDRVEAAEHALKAAKTPHDLARARLALARSKRGLPRLPDVLADDTPRCAITTVHGALSAVTSLDMDPFHRHGRAPFTTVVIDEAGLVPRAAAAAVALLAARQVVLVGDPRQLSPICIAARSMAPAVREWLALSGMEGVTHRAPHVQALLHQRRMHPAIGSVVSRFQYDCRLLDHESVRGRPLPEGFGRLSAWPRAAWIQLDQSADEDTVSVRAQRGPSRTWIREAGIRTFGRLLAQYPELERARGLFLSPYRGQATLAQDHIDARAIGDRWVASTVHAQQGAEADVVVFDLVRHGGWPAPEWKRLVNVALSRARHQLVFLAATEELRQPWLDGLREELTPCSIAANGALRVEQPRGAQASLFPTVDPVEEVAAPVARPDAPHGSGQRIDPNSLGAQILNSRAARRSLTLAQSRLIQRDLRDLGPRVVRGVAGSGKTIVLARWVALELHKHDREATVVFGNTSLLPHLRNLISQAWRVTADDPRAEPPWDRIHLLHVGQLLRDLLQAAGEADTDSYDYDEKARRIKPHGLTPRFGLLYVDEAQDLGHDTLDLLISLVVPDGTIDGEAQRPVRIFYDNAQNIYGRSTPRWTEFGLDMRGRSTILRESFRATRPAMELALDVLDQLEPLRKDEDFREFIEPRRGPPLLVQRADGTWRADFCVVQGQAPEIALFDDWNTELRALVEAVVGWRQSAVEDRDIRVLAPTAQRCAAIVDRLTRAGVPAVFARRGELDARASRVLVTTPHSFKGYEAEVVAVAGVDGFCTRAGELLHSALYVALTRARTVLRVSAARVPAHAPGARLVAALRSAADKRQV